MKHNALLKTQELPDGTCVICFPSLRNVRRVYSDFVRILNALSNGDSKRQILLDFTSLTGAIYSPAAVSIAGIVDFYRENKSWSFLPAGKQPVSYFQNTGFAHPKLQPVISFIAELKHFLSCHGGIRTEYLGLYAAWVAFKSSVREGKIDDRIDLLESYCFQTKVTFRVKDRYGRKK